MRRGIAAWVLIAGCAGGVNVGTGSQETTGGPGSSGSGGSGSGGTTAPTSSSGETSGGETSSTGGPSTGTSAAETGTGSTGGPDEPPLEASLITDSNRAYMEMMGGWGPHLRGLMRDEQDTLWFVVDGGESVLKNQLVRYFRRGAGQTAWSQVAEQTHTDAVQQNAGSVLLGDFIYTYGVNTTQHFLEECYFQTTNPDYRACNAVLISGQVYQTPDAANYVGAAVLGDGARIVWFTVVGANGGPGQFVYTYNFGGGWNGPVVGGIGDGGNDVGYIHAMARADGTLDLVAQTYFGAYPNGTFGAAVGALTPGQPAEFLALESPDPAATIRSSSDVYVDAATGAAHVLAIFDAKVAYYHRPAGAAWADHLAPLYVFEDTYRARFVRPEGGPLWVVRGGNAGQGVTLHRAPGADAADAVDWAAAESSPLTAPAPGFGAPTAIYVESPTYQRAPVGGLNFALCGEYQVADALIYHVGPGGG